MINKYAVSIFFLAIFLFSFTGLKAQTEKAEVSHSKGKFLGKSSPLSTWKLKEEKFKEAGARMKAYKKDVKGIPNFGGKKSFPRDFSEGILPKNGDPLAKKQQNSLKTNMDEITILQDYDGIDFDEAQIWPPDCNGDIGLNYYVMTTNGGDGTIIHVYDKFTGELVEETTMTPLWSELGANPFGDPILFFDRLENRWVLTEFTFSSMLIAVSETSDPMGSYFAYEYPTGGLPDYPKYSNWTDAYFITTNEFNGFNPVYALDKEAMLAGEADPTIIQFMDMTKLDNYGGSFEVSSPIDFSGTVLPEEGTNFMAIRITDDEFPSVDTDAIQYYEFDPNFEDPASSTVVGPVDLTTAPYESNLCGYGLFDCLDQSDGSLLSAIHTVIMNRVQYRNFGTYESILLNFSVDVTGDNDSGVRWIELRKDSDSGWFIFQEGTFDPGDGVSRFMGSMTQDSKGNIMLAYAMVSENLDPSVGVTGRRALDPPGIMTFAEKVIIEGEQPSPVSRWGDYFSLTVDPADDATFWLTSEYMPADQDWSTRLTSMNIRRDSIDAQANQLLTPTSSDALTATEEITFQISNPGFKSISDVPWGVMLDGNIIETGIAVGILEPFETVDVTLATTADLSVIGEYQFKCYVGLEGDEYILNDTLRQTVRKLAMFDLLTLQSSNNPIAGCGEVADFSGIFRNVGTQDITEFTAEIYVNNVLQDESMSTVTLISQEEIEISFMDVPVMDGVNTIRIAASNVNGNLEEVMGNNEVEFEYTKLDNPVQATLAFKSDGFSNETSWNIVDANGVIVYEGSGYTGLFAEDVVELCLQEACFTFNLFDSFGDGWSTSDNYFLEIVQADGVKPLVLQDNNFGSIWSMEFCVPKVCEIEAEIEYEDSSSPGADDAAIFVNFAMANEGTEYSIDGGVTWQSSPLFTNLVSGTYEVVVRDEFGCSYTETVNVLVGLELEEDFKFVIAPNPTFGNLDLHITGFNGPSEIIANVIDNTGKSVGNYIIPKFSDGYKKTLLFPNLPAGVYYVAIQDKDFHNIKKFVKQ